MKKKALLFAPMGSVHRRFNSLNIKVLQDLDYEVHLLANFNEGVGTEKQNPEYVKYCEEQGIITHNLDFERHSLFGNLKFVKPIRELIEKEKFYLVHAHTETGGLILKLVGKVIGTKYIYTPHGMSFWKGSSLKSQLVYKNLEKWICSEMDTNIAINQEEYSYLNSWNVYNAKLVHGIGLDLNRFQNNELIENHSQNREKIREEFNIPNDANVVLSIGELDDNKNHKTVIEALADINDKNVYYIICGVGPNKEYLENYAKELGFKNLILAGYRRDIPNIIKSCDIFAFMSFHEGLPVSLMEAMAGGLPIIGSKIRGNVDLVEHNNNGFLVDPNDKENMIVCLKSLLNDKDLREKFIENSKKIINNYSKEAVYNELLNIYL